MTAVPGAMAVTNPDADTVATDVLSLLQVPVPFPPITGSMVEKVAVSPMHNRSLPLMDVTLALG